DSRPVLDAGLDLHRVRLDAPLPAGALALRARLLDDGAVAAAARARLREREQALALGLHAAAVALRADDGSGARPRAGAAALAARGHHLDRHLRVDAVQRVLEREVHLRLDVVPAHGLARGTRARASAPASEDPAEDVSEIAEVEVPEVDVRPAGGTGTPVLRAEAVV